MFCLKLYGDPSNLLSWVLEKSNLLCLICGNIYYIFEMLTHYIKREFVVLMLIRSSIYQATVHVLMIAISVALRAKLSRIRLSYLRDSRLLRIITHFNNAYLKHTVITEFISNVFCACNSLQHNILCFIINACYTVYYL